MLQIRQGDVLLIQRAAPRNSKSRPDLQGLRVPGERTGHAHVLEADVLEDTDHGARMLLHLPEPRAMTHDEHAPVQVPAGFWEPRLQREFSSQAGFLSRHRFD